MESLKIALVSDWYYPKLGGVAVHMHDLAIYLSKMGHEVDIVTNDLKTGKEVELERHGVGLVKVPGRVVRGLSISADAFTKDADSLLPFLREYDIVHGHHAFTPLSLKAVAAAKKSGKATLITTHSIDFENSGALKKLSSISHPYFRRYLSFPHRIIAVSGAARDFIKKFTNVPVEIIFNGVDSRKFKPPSSVAEKESLKEELGFGDGRIVLYVGRLEPRKGIGTLISAMKYVDGKLLIAGKGSMMPILRERVKRLGIQDRVVFLGQVDYSLLPPIYRASDLFVLPSHSEAFGIVLLEAMASGVPVIGTSVGGIPEIVDGCGLLVPPKNARVLASAMNELLTNENLARKLGLLGRRRIERVYSWDIIVKKILNVYRIVLEEVSNDGGE